MVHIPLERTINDTYRFTFRNILSLFGIAWFPGLLALAATAGFLWLIWPDLASLFFSFPADKDAAAQAVMRVFAKVFTVAGPLYLIVWVLQSMMVVGVQRKALGLIEGPVFFYFSLGSAVWRLILAHIVAFIVLYICVALIVLGVVLLFAAGESFHLPAVWGLVEAVAVIAAICACVYGFVRLIFFLPPAVVAEGGIGLGRAWQLGGGNFWRIVALVIVCVLAPMMGLGMISNVIITPFMMQAMIPLQQAAQTNQDLNPAQVWAQLWPAMKTVLPLMIGYQILTWPILLGLTNAVSALAYRNVTAADPLEGL